MALLSLAREEDCDHWAHHPNAMDGHSIHASDDRFGLTIGDHDGALPHRKFLGVSVVRVSFVHRIEASNWSVCQVWMCQSSVVDNKSDLCVLQTQVGLSRRRVQVVKGIAYFRRVLPLKMAETVTSPLAAVASGDQCCGRSRLLAIASCSVTDRDSSLQRQSGLLNQGINRSIAVPCQLPI